MAEHVRIYEVGPRDGLQNEATAIPTATKARFIELLADAGLREIEATSFVSPRAIPQLADADELMTGLPRRPGVRYPVLVPNERGMARAEAAGADALAVFTATTDAFTQANIGMTVAESLAAFAPVLARAADLGWWRRAYVSTAFGCPYTGRVEPAAAVEVAVRLQTLGVDEICFGDTIGVGVPGQVAALTGLAVEAGIALDRIAFHFHDTRGTALANVAAGLDAGVRCFDSAAGGTGRLPVRARGRRESRHRGPRVLPRRLRLGDGRRPRGGPGGGAPHRGRTRQAGLDQGRPGGRMGPDDGCVDRPRVSRAERPCPHIRSTNRRVCYRPRDGRRRSRSEPELRAAERL